MITFNLPTEFLGKTSFTLGAIGISFLAIYILHKLIDLGFVGMKKKITSVTIIAKTRTIRHLLKSVITIALFLIGLLTVLAQWGVNIAPILTGAGIIGLAFSFGAQTLVKDLISGFFIILEDQFSLGDRVKIGANEGIVERMTLRLTILRDKEGNRIYIPNSQVNNVVKYTKTA